MTMTRRAPQRPVVHAGSAGARLAAPDGRRTERRHPRTDAARLLELLNTLASTTLFHVAQHPRCAMGQVARAFGVTLPAVTHIADRLEQKRFLVRTADPADRRVSILELTPGGVALVRDLETLQLTALDRVLVRISISDRRRAVRGMTALVEAATTTEETTSAGRPRPRGVDA